VWGCRGIAGAGNAVARRYAAAERCVAALAGVSVCGRGVGGDGDFVWADSGAAHGIAEPARVAALGQPQRSGEGGTVPRFDAAGDGTNCAVGGGDYGGGVDAAQ